MTNQRKFDRTTKKIKCEVHSDTLTFSSTLNLSEGGVFISTPEPLPKGTSVILYLYVSEYDILQIEGDVKWNINDPEQNNTGMGIEFIDLNEQDRELIKNNIK